MLLWRPSIAALIIGTTYSLFLVGAARIDVTNVAWLQFADEPTQAFLGWSFLRLDPVWHFPPTQTVTLGWPLGISVSYTDSIPLVAIVARFMSPILPVAFQYFGLWAMMNFILTTYFAIRICQLFMGRLNAAALCGAALILIAPCLTDRALRHFALSSHFVILLSLWLYFRPYPRPTWWRLTVPQIGAVTLAASIQPYLAVMTGALSLAFFSRCLLQRRLSWLGTSSSFFVLVAAVSFTLLIFGYFVDSDLASYAGHGYPSYSFNLLSPISSRGLSAFVPPIADYDVRQREGFNYLGLGIIILLILNLRSITSTLSALLFSAHGPLLIICVSLTALAASTLVTAGPYAVLDITLPDFVVGLLSAFRASGRFFWPVGYLIMLGAVRLTWRNYGNVFGTTLLAFALVTQFVDEEPLRSAVLAPIDNIRPSPLTADVWQQLGRSVKRLIVLPASQCDSSLTPGGPYGFEIFGSLAAAQKIEINSVYLARIGLKASEVYCKSMLERFLQGEIVPATAYVISDDLIRGLRATVATSLECQRADGFNLCLPRGQP